MAKYNLINLLLTCFIIVFPVQLVSSSEVSPLGVVRESNDKILNMYKNLGGSNRENMENIFLIMDEVTDFTAMADRAIYQVCQGSAEGLCVILKEEFIQLLKFSATQKLGRYQADRFDYLTEEIENGQAVVKTIAYFKEDSIHLDYVLEKNGAGWVVVNYIADDVDTIRNYQKQFQRIVKKQSVESLVNRLKKKNEQYRKEAEG